MNALSDPFKQLVERRLWPVALLLVAALVAVPLLLTSEEQSPDVIPASTVAVPPGQGPTDAIVSQSDADRRDQVRSVLGDRKDPFRPAQIRRVPKAENGSSVGSGGTTTALQASASTGASASTNAGQGSSPASASPITEPPAASPNGNSDDTPDGTSNASPDGSSNASPTYKLYSLVVRFGDPSKDLRVRTLKRLTGLPGENPALLYLGLLDDHKTAIFMVDPGVRVVGDGKCEPRAGNCQTVALKPGDTESISRGGERYELKVRKIRTTTTTSAAEARAAREATAAGGRKALNSRLGRIGPYRYRAGSGTLERLTPAQQAKREDEAASRLTSAG